jgi:superfamily II DNA or RNA helicase
MPSKHKEAKFFINKNFFQGLKSFHEFEERTKQLSNTKEIGDAFEILVEGYLQVNPVFQANAVWLVGSVPLNIRKRLNLPSDTKGIDGVYEDVAGNLIPYQVKYRSDKETLSYTEVSSFLGLTEESLHDRVIFTNARELASDIANRKGLRSVRAAQFECLEEEDFSRINAWLFDNYIERKRFLPLPHQKEALQKITTELQKTNRTTAVMACGTGKTFVALWVAEQIQPKTVVVFIPSIALLSQFLQNWCKQSKWGARFYYLCVCSDASVDQSAQEDDHSFKRSDLEFNVTTEAKRVQSFLAINSFDVKVIFCTYQSAEVVAEGLNGKSIDLGIFDEAHKTTGPKEGLFAFGLSDENILIKNRLFLTATPRHYDLRKRKRDGDLQIVSMNDEQVYGKVSYRLSFSAAVAAGIIVPYKVIVSVSLNNELNNDLLRISSTLIQRNQIQSKWVANQLAIKRAIEATSAAKVITFHSQVRLANDFTSGGPQGFSGHISGFEMFHINGNQSAAERRSNLESFKAAPRGLISNARCLTEGVDVPSVDMVVFVDPKKSKIDIAQAVGRAMRKPTNTNKKFGYVVVPLFIERNAGETEAEALTRSGFDEVALVLGAMLENDDDFVDVIRDMQQAKGRRENFNPKRLHEKVELIGPDICLNDLRRSIDVEIVDRLGMSWDYWYGLLETFFKREGHCRISTTHEEDGLKLGNWASNQRSRLDRLTTDQVERLNSLNFSWDSRTEQWEQYFLALQRYKQRESNCNVDATHEEDGLKLGAWVGRQRSSKDQLTPDQIHRLDFIGFSWDPLAEQWEDKFEALQRFYRLEGHCRVPRGYQADQLKLDNWVSRQRSSKDQLSPNQIKRLNSLGFSWDPLDEQWNDNLAGLQRFHKREGHCNVVNTHEEDGLKLGSWVRNLRSRRYRLTPDQLSALESLGFVWDPRSQQWEMGFAALQIFCKREGHCRVAHGHEEDGLKLGNWVGTQRLNRNELTADQMNRLNSLSFSWDPRAEQWEEGFVALQSFYKREGHCRVAQGHQENGLKLHLWMGTQRWKRDELTVDQVNRLNSLNFSWDPRTEQWEDSFAALLKFYKREGHCRVPRGYEEDRVRLGIWVSRQRSNRNQLTPDRLNRLNSLGLIWDHIAGQWEDAFAVLQKFHKREGHCRVPQGHQEDGLKLGSWIGTQRCNRDQLTPDQVNRLNSLGFEQDPHTQRWEEGFAALQKFYKREGHCRVLWKHQEGGQNLGAWVMKQRSKIGVLSPDQISSLNSLGFSWDPLAEQWNDYFVALQKFNKREGHCNVATKHEENGIKLGSWLRNLRSRTDKLTPDQISRLESLGFVCSPHNK